MRRPRFLHVRERTHSCVSPLCLSLAAVALKTNSAGEGGEKCLCVDQTVSSPTLSAHATHSPPPVPPPPPPHPCSPPLCVYVWAVELTAHPRIVWRMHRQ